jgi:urease accessory protein
VTIHVSKPLGGVEDARFADRRVVGVPVAWDEASRQRLRRPATDGTDVAIVMDDAWYLADGTVLHDDGERIFVVTRSRERALVVRFNRRLSLERIVAQALALGYAFGDQHVPVEVEDGEAHIPLTSSEAITRATVDELALDGVTLAIADVALGSRQPMLGGHPHRHQ